MIGTDQAPASARSPVEAAHELHEGEKAEAKIAIHAPIAQVYAFLRNFENLPRFLTGLEQVEMTGPRHARWKYKSADGVELVSVTELIAETENKMISWQSLASSDVLQAGSVWLQAMPGEATELHAFLRVDSKTALAVGASAQLVLERDLETLRKLLETASF